MPTHWMPLSGVATDRWLFCRCVHAVADVVGIAVVAGVAATVAYVWDWYLPEFQGDSSLVNRVAENRCRESV